MKRLSTIVTFMAVILIAGSCSNNNVKVPKTDTSSSMGPAPDNNSANNPSLADTSYEKNRTKPITDTMKKK